MSSSAFSMHTMNRRLRRVNQDTTRREFLAQAGAFTAAALLPFDSLFADARSGSHGPLARVAIVRDDALTAGPIKNQGELLRMMLDAAMQRLIGAPTVAEAWARLFASKERVGIKVNTLGLSTQPAVVDTVVRGLLQAGIQAENIIIWDRFDVELAQAGFKLNRSSRGVRCCGTDAERVGSGYEKDVQVSGQIGSCYSKIVADEVDALISVPVLKDHNLAGVSLGMKNFYGAIHNPNKYHNYNCDPFIADVVSHDYIRPKWRLTVCDATRAQYHAGPAQHPGFAWPFGGLIVSTDFVAADAVAAHLLEQKRAQEGLPSLADEERPARHIATAGDRGLGVADLSRIERMEV
jgi:uncharacterized protein (DUF362 family)